MPVALSLRLPPERTSPAAARTATRDCLAPELDAGDVELVVLVVSELVTNAVLHAGTACQLRVRTSPAAVRVEVSDGDTRHPVRRLSPTDTAGTGRGLRMLQALGERWGVDPEPDGKVVWWELALSR